MLAVSGRLNLKAGGPSVMVPVDPELVKLLYKPVAVAGHAATGASTTGASIYLIAKRNLRLPFLEAFDAPDAADELRRGASRARTRRRRWSCSTARSPTTWPRRSPTGSDARAGADARRAWSTGPSGWPLGRPPTPTERGPGARVPARRSRCEEFALALFNLNGFLYVH